MSLQNINPKRFTGYSPTGIGFLKQDGTWATIFDISGKLSDNNLSSNVALKNASNIFTLPQYIENPSSTNAALVTRLSAGSTGMFALYVSGKLEWGNGTSTRDVNLYRNQYSQLQTDNSFVASFINANLGLFVPNGSNLANGGAIGVTTSSYFSGFVARLGSGGTGELFRAEDSNNIRLVSINASGKIIFGANAITNLYSSYDGGLKTDLDLIVGRSLYTPIISNPSTSNNSAVSLTATGTEISTAVSANVGLKVVNTVTSATGDLLQLIKGTSVMARIGSNGEVVNTIDGAYTGSTTAFTINATQTGSGIGGGTKYGLLINQSGAYNRNLTTRVVGLYIPAYNGTTYSGNISAQFEDGAVLGGNSTASYRRADGLLQLHGTASNANLNDNTIFLSDIATTSSNKIAGIVAGNNTTNLSSAIYFKSTGTNRESDITLNTSNDGLLAERLRVKGSNGNILIGTSTDSGFKLDINGTTRLNGAVTVGALQVFNSSGALSDSALSTNVALKNIDNNFSTTQSVIRTNITDWALTTRATGNISYRFAITADGKTQWGDGTNAVDTNLYRAAVGILKTDGEFHSSAFRASTFSNLTSGNNAQVAPTNTGTEIRTAIINNVALKVINTDNTANGNLTEWIKGSTTVARITSAGRLAVADGIENIGGSGLTLKYNGSMYLSHTNGNNDFIMVGADTDPDMNFAYTSAKEVNTMIFQRKVTPIAGNTGAITFNAININNRVTYTNSGAGSLARGVYVNPVLVSVSDYRGIEMANNVGWGIYQTGASAKNYFAGNTLIGTTLDQGFKLDVSGNVRLSNTATSSDVLMLTSPLSVHNVSYIFSTDSAKKLIIQGTSAASTVFINQTDLHVKGASNTSATNALSVMNSDNTSTFKVANNGDITGTNGIVKLGLWNGDGHQIGSLKIDYVSGNNPSISGVGGSINLDSTLIFGAGSTAQITTHTSKTNDLTLSHGRTNADYGVRIQTYDGSNVYQTRFRVGAGSGAFAYFNTTNLGIGTTTDAGFRLDVNGTTRLNGAVTVGSLQVFDAAGNLADGTLSGNVAFKNIDNNFTLDQTINGLTVGKGGSNVPGNTVVGLNSLLSNTTGNYNVVLGHSASKLSTTASSNVAIGYESLMSQVTGSANVAVGRGTLRDYTGTNSQVAVGYHALNKLTTGTANTALGFAVMANATTGGYNSGVGYYALLNVTTGLYNSAFGVDALKNLTTSHYNVAIGNSTLATLTTGERNTAVGYAAGVLNNVGVQNTYVGFESGYNSTSNHNTFIGYQSGKPVTTGFLNTFIGHNSGSGITTGSYNTIIGSAANLLPTLANHIILSDGQGNQRMVIDNTGKWFFTSSKETNLYEDIPGTLRTDGAFRTGSSIISDGTIFATSGLSNSSTGANAIIIPSNTGTDIRTSVATNIALRVINNNTTPTADLTTWTSNSSIVATVTSNGSIHSGTNGVRTVIKAHGGDSLGNWIWGGIQGGDATAEGMVTFGNYLNTIATPQSFIGLTKAGNVSIGGVTTTAARLHVRGAGLTSSTTSLRIDNSSGIANLTLTDNGVLTIKTGLIVGTADVVLDTDVRLTNERVPVAKSVDITKFADNLILNIDDIPFTEIIKLETTSNWDEDGKYIGEPIVNCLQGTEYYTSDDMYYIRMRSDNEPKRMLIG